MASPPDASFFENLPPALQIAISAGLGVATTVAAWIAYITKRDSPKEGAKADFVLSTASFADMGPVREAARHLGDLAEEARRIVVEVRCLAAETKAQREALDALVHEAREQSKDAEVERRVRNEMSQRRGR